MNITLSDITGSSLYIVPIVPPDVTISIGGQNETMNTVKGDIRLVGNESLTGISWSSIFPVYKDYRFCAVGSLPNGFEYVEFLKSSIKAKMPIRIIVTSLKKRPIVNILATVDEGFDYRIDKAGDIAYSIKLTEFPSDVWDFANASPNMRKFLSSLTVQSVARKALSKVGLI